MMREKTHPMNETASHFISVCPNCSASLRVNRKHVGQDVICKHCQHTFRAMMTYEQTTTSSAERTAEPSIQPLPPAERIAVSCPGCRATLSVRRVYIGREVRCKQCDNTFLVPAPALSAPEESSAASSPQPGIERESDGTETERELLRAQHDQLLADHERLQIAHNELDANHDRLKVDFEQLKTGYDLLKTEHGHLLKQQDRLTTELDSIRDCLGTISPEQVRPLAEERESLRAEVNRLRDEMNVLVAERPARALLAAELAQRDVELTGARAERELLAKQIEQRDKDLRTVRAERDLLTRQIEQRDKDLKTVRAECDLLATQVEQGEVDLNVALVEQGRLSIERKNVVKEVEQLRSALEERDRAMRSSTDALRAEADGLREALDLAEQTHHDDVARLNEQRNLAHEQGENVVALQGESAQLRAEVESLRQALGLAEQAHRDDRDQLSAELAALGERHRQLQDQHEATQQTSQAAGDLEALRDQVADLKRQLSDSEFLNREMSDVLRGMGINYKPMKI